MNYDTQRLNNALDAAHRQIQTLTAERDDAYDALMDAVHQACYTEGDEVDSMALSAYARALRLLAKAGRFAITHEVGRRVVGRWVQGQWTNQP